MNVSLPRFPYMEKPQDLAEGLSDDTAISLIKSFIKLYPTTFFFKEKIEALAILTDLPPQTVEKVTSQVLADGLSVPTYSKISSKFSKSSVTTTQSLQTAHNSLSLETAAQSQLPETAEDRQCHACFKQPNGITSLQSKKDTCPLELGLKQTQIYGLPRSLVERPILKQAAESLLDGKAEKCRPTPNRALLSRDEEKIYQCTFKCGARFTRKADLRRHEEEKNYPQEGWICDVNAAVLVDGIRTCAYCKLQNPSMTHAAAKHRNRVPFCHEKGMDARGKIFTRKKRFVEHFKTFHPALPVADYLNTYRFVVESKFPRWCGFCAQSQDFNGSKARNDHMASHFESGLDMSKWRDPIGLNKTVDEDGDTDGDGDQSDEDANDDIDDDEDHEILDSNGHPKDGFSSGDRSQSNTGTANCPFSILALNEFGQPSFKQEIGNSRHHSGRAFVRELKTYGIVQFSKACKTPPFVLNTSNSHKTAFWDALDGWPNSSQQASKQQEEFQRPQMRETRTEESTLEIRLRQARVYYTCSRCFIPITELERLITFNRVFCELERYYPQAAAELNAKIASLIVSRARTVFAILVLIGKGSAIMDLLEEITDLDLPINRARCKVLKVFTLWTAKAIEDFDRDQWSFISPVFDQLGLHYELDDHVVLPFTENNERHRLISGGYSDVWSVRIHPAHQKIFQSSLVRQRDLEILI